MFKKFSLFLRGVLSELEKVTWPGKKELIASTIIVIVLVFIISFYIGFVDFVLAWLLNVVIQ
jgi:preprotein translocase subunit SecE